MSGRIPAELNGRYLRNGPNPLSVEEPVVHIWGMGQGMVHGVRLREGRAEWYRNRFVRTPGFAPMVHVIEHAQRTFAMAEGADRFAGSGAAGDLLALEVRVDLAAVLNAGQPGSRSQLAGYTA